MKSFFSIALFLVIKSSLVNAQQTTSVIGSIKDTSNLYQLADAAISLISFQ
jgi:hypothetical protein